MRPKNLAYTLIELLFVIAILGVLAAMSISFYARQSMVFKAEKAAQQMQHLLLAATMYYEKNKMWPNGPLSRCKDPDSKPDYCEDIPSGVLTDPWGGEYSWNVSPDGLFLEVATAKHHDETIAQHIQHLLPNATFSAVSDDDYKVVAKTVIPAHVLKPKNLFVYGGAGVIKGAANSSCMTEYHCSPSRKPIFQLMVNSLDSMRYDLGHAGQSEQVAFSVGGKCTADGKDGYQLLVTHKISDPIWKFTPVIFKPEQVSVLYIVTCS